MFYDDAQNVYGIKRPGRGKDVPAWKDLLGSVPNPRGLATVMRTGHRNTNQVLTFSICLLLGSFSETNPEMKTFADIGEYEKQDIPNDSSLNHPNAGKKCIEPLGDRLYRVNFCVCDGPPPVIHRCLTEEDMIVGLAKNVEKSISSEGDNVSPSDILIVAPYQSQVLKIKEALEARGISTHLPIKVNVNGQTSDGRDSGCFVDGKVTVSTIKSAKGYTAHVCHLAFVESLEDKSDLKKMQEARAQIHVACTRSSLTLSLWGLRNSALIHEAERAREFLGE